MTDISAITAATGSNSALSQQSASLGDNFEMFLTLLTEQMKNQDPLDPLDSTQFVSQLVDFSSVEQQIQQNQNLENLLLLQSAAAQASAVSYIGRVGLAETAQVEMTNSEATWEYTMPENARSTTLIVKDEDGRELGRFDGNNNTGTHNFTWDGLDTAGSQMPDGVYPLEVLSVEDDGNNITPTSRAQGLVTGVDLSGNEVIVEMGGIRVPLSSVLSLREDGTV